MHKKLNKNLLDNPDYQDINYKKWIKEMLLSYYYNKQCNKFTKKLKE